VSAGFGESTRSGFALDGRPSAATAPALLLTVESSAEMGGAPFFASPLPAWPSKTLIRLTSPARPLPLLSGCLLQFLQPPQEQSGEPVNLSNYYGCALNHPYWPTANVKDSVMLAKIALNKIIQSYAVS
jgi:hypothetical protein